MPLCTCIRELQPLEIDVHRARFFWNRPDPRRSNRHASGRTTGSGGSAMIRKLKSGEYRLYSKKLDPKSGKRRNLGTFSSRAAAQKHERAVQYFKRRG